MPSLHSSRTKRDNTAFKSRMQQHGRHERPNAESTVLALKGISSWWQRYCDKQMHEDSDEALRDADAPELKTFFQWLVDNAKREPPQANTLKQYFRVLKMRYKDLTGTDLDLDRVTDVNNFIDHHLQGKGRTAPRSKPVPSGEDFVNMVHFHYAKDTARYENERQRVQQAFLMIIHASSGLRPSSTTRTYGTLQTSDKEQRSPEFNAEDDSSGEDGEDPSTDDAVSKLRYRDLQLSAIRTDSGTRYLVQPRFRHFKGETRRAQRKTFQWPDQDDVLTCPVSHLLALALDDNAFAAGISSAAEFFKIGIPDGDDMLPFPWRREILDIPIMRKTPDLKAQELSNGATLKRLSSLGKNICGYKESLTWYCLRRMGPADRNKALDRWSTLEENCADFPTVLF